METPFNKVSRRLLVSVLISLLFFQLIYSFLFPAVDFTANWLPIGSYLPKFQLEGADNLILGKFLPLISSEYRLNSDVGNYLELARHFSPEYFEGHVFLNRPLYPFLIFLFSLPFGFFVSISFGIIFGLAILVNLLLAVGTVVFFFLLLEKIFTLRVSFLSSVLLIFSPYFHIGLAQPLAEMLMAFGVALSAYLLFNYIKKPSIKKLIVYSLIVGIFMLGKMFFAISIFILLLALWFRRHKEGLVFLAVHLLPLFFWYIWVTRIWQIPYFINEVQNWEMGVWLMGIFQPPLVKTISIFLWALPNFVKALSFGFLLIPLIFSIIGFSVWRFGRKYLIYFGSLFSLFALLFIMNIYLAHHAFLLFPVVYPTAILGIEKTAQSLGGKRPWLYSLFYIFSLSLIIIVSGLNPYRFFDWL